MNKGQGHYSMALSFLLCTSVNSVMIIFKDKAKPSQDGTESNEFSGEIHGLQRHNRGAEENW